MRASVILCTYNPNRTRLQRVLDALAAQSMPSSEWEILLVDNASRPPVSDLGMKMPANLSLVLEPTPGLLYARIAGLEASHGDVIIFCDDDNVFVREYLEVASVNMERDVRLGLASGSSHPEFESEPPTWVHEFFGNLALYYYGPNTRRVSGMPAEYPAFIGGGCGAVFRREALLKAFCSLRSRSETITGRRGGDLTSGEDNDIVLTILRQGWDAAYLPDLGLTHLIPKGRISEDYLARLSEAIARSWVKVLHLHGISPWRPTSRVWLPFQMARSYLRTRAWSDPASYVRWRAACGHFLGRADLYEAQRLTSPPKSRRQIRGRLQ